jgi:hypothetical protein
VKHHLNGISDRAVQRCFTGKIEKLDIKSQFDMFTDQKIGQRKKLPRPQFYFGIQVWAKQLFPHKKRADCSALFCLLFA